MEKIRERVRVSRACDGCGKHSPVIRYTSMSTAFCTNCLHKDLKKRRALIKKLPMTIDKPAPLATDPGASKWADYIFKHIILGSVN